MWPRIHGLRAMELGTPGALRDQLNALTLAGTKRATAGLIHEYEIEGETLETIGERLALLDSEGSAIATIEITDVSVMPFDTVPWTFAQAEGEGFTSIDHWRETHIHYFKRANGIDVEADTPIVCLHYRLVSDTDARTA